MAQTLKFKLYLVTIVDVPLLVYKLYQINPPSVHELLLKYLFMYRKVRFSTQKSILQKLQKHIVSTKLHVSVIP
uniref:Uncharacterized protein n=1 Tax=Setaria italica TaxID=4555 RepID=K3YLQ1_SETIT